MLIKVIAVNTIVRCSISMFAGRDPAGRSWLDDTDAKVWWAGQVGPGQPEEGCLQSPLLAGSDGLQDRQGVPLQSDLSSCQD